MYFTTIGKILKLNKCEYTCERIILHTRILQYITSNINLSMEKKKHHDPKEKIPECHRWIIFKGQWKPWCLPS